MYEQLINTKALRKQLDNIVRFAGLEILRIRSVWPGAMCLLIMILSRGWNLHVNNVLRMKDRAVVSFVRDQKNCATLMRAMLP